MRERASLETPQALDRRLWTGFGRYVTQAAREAAAGAEVLVGGKRLLELFPDVLGRTNPARGRHRGRHRADRCPARGGAEGSWSWSAVIRDCYSLAQNVIRRVRPARIAEVVPAVSSVQVAFARLGMDWSDARILSAHGRIPAIAADDLAEADKIAILAGTKEALRWSAATAAALRSEPRGFLWRKSHPGRRAVPSR